MTSIIKRKIGPFIIETTEIAKTDLLQYKTTITDTRSTTERSFYSETVAGSAYRLCQLLADLTKADEEFAALSTLKENL